MEGMIENIFISRNQEPLKEGWLNCGSLLTYPRLKAWPAGHVRARSPEDRHRPVQQVKKFFDGAVCYPMCNAVQPVILPNPATGSG